MPTIEELKTQFKTDNPTLHKVVDGETIQLSSEEYEETINRWAQNSYNQQQEDDIKEHGGVSVKYASFRREAYAPIEDQLDMQYHDSLNGTTVWQDHIAAVKAKYPKP